LTIETLQPPEFRQAVPLNVSAKIRPKALPEGHDRADKTMLDRRLSQGGTAGSRQTCYREQANAFDAKPRALPNPLLLAVLSWPLSANAGENIQSTKKLGKNYFVVRKPNSGDDKIEAKKVPNDFMVGKSPYASQKYAEAAIETFPECTSAKKKSKE
jgi:hypothetical protein